MRQQVDRARKRAQDLHEVVAGPAIGGAGHLARGVVARTEERELPEAEEQCRGSGPGSSTPAPERLLPGCARAEHAETAGDREGGVGREQHVVVSAAVQAGGVGGEDEPAEDGRVVPEQHVAPGDESRTEHETAERGDHREPERPEKVVGPEAQEHRPDDCVVPREVERVEHEPPVRDRVEHDGHAGDEPDEG